MTSQSANLIYEACVDSLEDAVGAQLRGANRIELCSALDKDGLTPTIELTMQCIEKLTIPIMVMIHPRGGDFVYSESEIKQMEIDLARFKEVGVAGVVFGLLNDLNLIDIDNTCRLVKLAFPLEVTFHKAIDFTPDLLKAFKELNSIEGITRVLTSGSRNTAWNGREVIKAMNNLPERRIRIIAAGKVLPENRVQIAEYTGVTELHGKKIV